jgi:hypothetical protein
LRDQADEAFIRAHAGDVDRVAVQTLGCKQFEGVVIAHHVDRAHLGDHVRRDEDDDPVEALLRADRLRHGFAEPAQQQARASGRSGHRVVNPGRPAQPRLVSRWAGADGNGQAWSRPYSEWSVRTASSV